MICHEEVLVSRKGEFDLFDAPYTQNDDVISRLNTLHLCKKRYLKQYLAYIQYTLCFCRKQPVTVHPSSTYSMRCGGSTANCFPLREMKNRQDDKAKKNPAFSGPPHPVPRGETSAKRAINSLSTVCVLFIYSEVRMIVNV